MDKTVAFYPGPAGATESELDLDAWSTISGADTRLSMLRRRRRSAAGAGARPRPRRSRAQCRGRVLPGAHRRLLRIRRQTANVVAGLRRWSRSTRVRRRVLRRGSRRGARWPRCERPDVHHLGRDRGTLFGHASSHRAHRHRGSRRRADPGHRAAVPDPHRAAAAALLRRRGRRPGRPVRAAGALGQHPTHLPVAAQHRDGARASPAPPRSHCRWSAPTTSKWRRRSICTPCATAPSRSCSSSVERFSCQASADSPSIRCRGNARPSTNCRWRCGSQLIRLHYPNAGWVRLQPRHDLRAGRLQVGPRHARLRGCRHHVVGRGAPVAVPRVEREEVR